MRRQQACADREDESAFIRKYQRLARDYAYFVMRTRKPFLFGLDMDDLVSAALQGILGAYRVRHLIGSAPLEAVVRLRIRWAIQNEIRKMDPTPPAWRTAQRALREASARLESSEGEATDAALGEALGLDSQAVWQLRASAAAASPTVVSECVSGEEEGVLSRYDLCEDGVGPSAEDVVAGHTARHLLLEAIDSLPDRTRGILLAHFYEDRSLQEIAETLGISKQRVAQLKDRGLATLRSRLGAEVDAVVFDSLSTVGGASGAY